MQLIIFPPLGPLIGAVTFHSLVGAELACCLFCSSAIQPQLGMELGVETTMALNLEHLSIDELTELRDEVIAALNRVTARQKELKAEADRLGVLISFDARKQSLTRPAKPKL